MSFSPAVQNGIDGNTVQPQANVKHLLCGLDQRQQQFLATWDADYFPTCYQQFIAISSLGHYGTTLCLLKLNSTKCFPEIQFQEPLEISGENTRSEHKHTTNCLPVSFHCYRVGKVFFPLRC